MTAATMITNIARSTPTTAPTMAPIFDDCSSLGDLSEKVNLQLKYSGTSDKGPSKIGTTSLQRTLVSTRRDCAIPNGVVFEIKNPQLTNYFNCYETGNLSKVGVF